MKGPCKVTCQKRVLSVQVYGARYGFGVLQSAPQIHGGFGFGELELGKPGDMICWHTSTKT